MKQLISLLLCITILLSSSLISADEINEDLYYGTISVEFSDNSGNLEKIQIMVQNNNIYANAKELGMRLGYNVNISDKYVSIYNKEFNENIPYCLTVFYYNSTHVKHMLFTQMVDSYEAPFDTVKNDDGVWIPLEYSLLLLNSSMLIINNTICIDIPNKNIVDIYMDILQNNQKYLFEWQNDIGISKKNESRMGEASFIVSLFNGLLKLDGESWLQGIQLIALDTSTYDAKYAEDLALLFCTYSNDELSNQVKEMKEKMSPFNGKNKLSEVINEIDKDLDKNLATLLNTSETLKKHIDLNNNASIISYNKSYQALENACDKADFFSDATELYTKVGNEVAEATSFLNMFYNVAEVVGFATEFKNQDTFALNSLMEFTENSDSQKVMSTSMKESISVYSHTLQTDIVTYSGLRWLEENYDKAVFEKMNLTSALGLPANLMLIGWDLAEDKIPFYKEGLSNTNSFMLSMYAGIFQADSFTSYQNLRNTIFDSVGNITPENLYKVSQYCYTYLKACYITRNAALGALSSNSKKEIPNVIEYQNSINQEISRYLVQLKNADTVNAHGCFGFLPEDNKEYLENYQSKNLLSIIETKSMENAYNEILERYKEACAIGGNEWLDHLELYNSRYSDLNTGILEYYHTAVHYDDITEEDLPCALLYTYYDIDNNGIPELLLASAVREIECFDIYIYDGKSAKKLFDNDPLSYNSYEIYTNGIIAQYDDEITYYKLDNINYEIAKIESVNATALLEYQWSSNDWTIFAEDIIATTNSNIIKQKNEKISKEQICRLVATHYNQINNTDVYVVFDDDCSNTEDGYFVLLRSQASNSANILVAGIYINIGTGEVIDDLGYSWNLYE